MTKNLGKRAFSDNLLVTVGYQAVCCIVRGYADLDSVADHDLDPVLLHSSGQHAPYHDIIVTFNFHAAATQDFGDRTIQLD